METCLRLNIWSQCSTRKLWHHFSSVLSRYQFYAIRREGWGVYSAAIAGSYNIADCWPSLGNIEQIALNCEGSSCKRPMLSRCLVLFEDNLDC